MRASGIGIAGLAIGDLALQSIGAGMFRNCPRTMWFAYPSAGFQCSTSLFLAIP